MITRIECANKSEFFDAEAVGVKNGAVDLGINKIDKVYFSHVTYLKGAISRQEQQIIAEKLLADNVTQEYALEQPINHTQGTAWSVEVTFNRGVTDLVAETSLKGIQDLGIRGVEAAKTARRYEIVGDLSDAEKETIVQKLLMNKVNEHVVQPNELIFAPAPEDHFELKRVPLIQADDAELIAISRQRDLYLNLAEMQTIRDHFKSIGREPTDIELEMLAQTWSEHCSHKTLTGLVEYNGELIDNPLKQTIFRVTHELNKPWCLSVFKDNAGVIAFDEEL
ncbi:MAG: phosphoribosylformylglycinamidine synthase, partial [Calditrichaeota bacterium]